VARDRVSNFEIAAEAGAKLGHIVYRVLKNQEKAHSFLYDAMIVAH